MIHAKACLLSGLLGFNMFNSFHLSKFEALVVEPAETTVFYILLLMPFSIAIKLSRDINAIVTAAVRKTTPALVAIMLGVRMIRCI